MNKVIWWIRYRLTRYIPIWRCFFCKALVFKGFEELPISHNSCLKDAMLEEFGEDYTLEDYARDHIIEIDYPGDEDVDD